MITRVRRLIALLGALCGVVFLAAGPAAAGAPAGPYGNRLDAGHRWLLSNVYAQSASGRYTLYFSIHGGLDLQEDVRLPGHSQSSEFDLWRGFQENLYRDCSHGYLAMQTDGNLVLYCRRGHPIWSTHTAGTGTHNHFSVQDNGNLVVRTASGRRVWASGSTDPFITTGQRLEPGRRIRVQDWDHPFVSLTMRRSGDLVLTYGRRVAWHTNTHVPGSRAVLRTSGNLVVVAPHGRVQWASHTAAFGVGSVLVLYDEGRIATARLTGRHGHQQWERSG